MKGKLPRPTGWILELTCDSFIPGVSLPLNLVFHRYPSMKDVTSRVSLLTFSEDERFQKVIDWIFFMKDPFEMFPGVYYPIDHPLYSNKKVRIIPYIPEFEVLN